MEKILIMLALLGFCGGAYANPAIEQLKEGAGTEAAELKMPAAPEASAREAAAQDAIDAAQEACADSGVSTADYMQCLSASYEKWDARLNEVYKELLGQLAPEGKASRRQAQRAWLVYRDANAGFLNEYYKEMGSLGRLSQSAAAVSLVRSRALTLQNRLSLYDGSDGLEIDDTVTPIDAAFNACQDQNPHTNGTLACIDKASQDWYAELNGAYGSVMSRVTPAGASALRAAQLAWLAFRDAEIKTSDVELNSLTEGYGSMHRVANAYVKLDLVRQRTLSLAEAAE
jgi:uncharacterized protein YecT (DUF1311 family)